MKEIVLIGSGGCMRELAWQIFSDSQISKLYKIIGFIDLNNSKKEINIGELSIPYLGDDNYLLHYSKPLNIVLSIGDSKLRKKLYLKYKKNTNLEFPNIILSNVSICQDLKIGEGNIITHESVISTNVKIGDFVFLNSQCLICHDCIIDDFVTLSPRSQIAGNVKIGELTELGMNSTVIQGLELGNNVKVGAGATVINNIENNSTVVGVPARKVVKNESVNNSRSRC